MKNKFFLLNFIFVLNKWNKEKKNKYIEFYYVKIVYLIKLSNILFVKKMYLIKGDLKENVGSC